MTQRLQSEERTRDDIQRVTEPLWPFHSQLPEKVESYERLRRGQCYEILNLHGLGRLLIGLRIARNMTQRKLAEKRGVHESQVSRDERNDYHGITVQRAATILDSLGARLMPHLEIEEDNVHQSPRVSVSGESRAGLRTFVFETALPAGRRFPLRGRTERNDYPSGSCAV